MTNDKDYYQTQSLLVAATLLCFGVPLESTTRELGGKSTFSFLRTNDLDKLLESFWKRVLVVEPNAFWDSIKFVKNLVHDPTQIPEKGVNADGSITGNFSYEAQQSGVARKRKEISEVAEKT